ncbi:MAG: ATP-binding protein [Kiritimatiellae bacterium]|nr:ATP-binding protein [Kiritimatiellia bacterium]
MKSAIKEVLREFYQDGLPSGIVHRDVQYYECAHAATVIKGMRRTGKTFVTYERIEALLKKGVPLGRIVHLNFEDDRIKNIRLEELQLINEVHAELFPEHAHEACWYFLDELQNVGGWEAYARRLVDSPKVTLCLTGSSSRLFSEEIATAMRGRAVPIEVFPLSFHEFLRFNGTMSDVPQDGFTAAERGIFRNAMSRYFAVGGFPAVQGMPDAARIATLQEYVHAVLYRDVLQRHKVVSVQSLMYTLDYLLHNFARRTSAHAISGVLKNLAYPSRREDVADYVSYFKDAYLVYPVPVMSDSLAVRRVNPDKYYVIDTGLVNAVTPKMDAVNGWKLENLVFMSLRRGTNKITYCPLDRNREVDFCISDQVTGKRSLVQVAWTMDDENTFPRELSALRDARVKTGIDDCTVVTWDSEATLPDGIKIVPVWKWCLMAGR